MNVGDKVRHSSGWLARVVGFEGNDSFARVPWVRVEYLENATEEWQEQGTTALFSQLVFTVVPEDTVSTHRPLPLSRCVHCDQGTTERAHNEFREGDCESGPYSFDRPAHEACCSVYDCNSVMVDA